MRGKDLMARKISAGQHGVSPSRRRFLRAGGLVTISAFVPSLGCDSNEVSFLSTPAGPDMDMVDMPMDQMPRTMVTVTASSSWARWPGSST